MTRLMLLDRRGTLPDFTGVDADLSYVAFSKAEGGFLASVSR